MNKITFAVIISLVLVACSKKEITAFKADAAINFVDKTVEYTFLANPVDEYIQEINVRIIGDTANYDRTFAVEVVKDTFTTAADNQYQIMGGEVKAGEFTGILRVKLFNAPALANSRVSVKLRLVNSKDFKSGNVEASQFIVSWTDKIVLPSWSYFRYFFTSVGSSAAYRIIVQTTGLTTFTAAQYGQIGDAGVRAMATVFGDYVKQWNKDHPNDHLKHDDGTQAGKEIVPLYYSHAKYD